MRRPRLGRGAAVLLVVLLGLTTFGLTLPTWVRGVAATTVGTAEVAVSGVDAVPGASSAGLVVAVAGLVLALSGRVTRVLAVLGVGLGGAVTVVSAAQLLADPAPVAQQAAAEVTGAPELVGPAALSALPALTLVVGVLTVLTGIALPFLLGRWQRVGRRYERTGTPSTVPSSEPAPDARHAQGRVRAMDDWDALSRGEDPSSDQTTSRATEP